MTANLHFSIVRHVPDPARGEGLNIAVIMVGPAGYIGIRATTDYRRIKKIDPAFDERILTGIREEWPAWLKAEGERIGYSDGRLLENLSLETSGWSTAITQPRVAEVETAVETQVTFDDVLEKIFARLVKSPRGRPSRKKQSAHINLKQALKQEFRQLHLMDNVIHEGQLLEGTMLYPVAYAYQNGHKVAIDTVEVAPDAEIDKRFSDSAARIFGKWTDIKSAGKEPPNMEYISIIPSGDSPLVDQARRLLSNNSLVIAFPDERDQLRAKLQADWPQLFPPGSADNGGGSKK